MESSVASAIAANMFTLLVLRYIVKGLLRCLCENLQDEIMKKKIFQCDWFWFVIGFSVSWMLIYFKALKGRWLFFFWSRMLDHDTCYRTFIDVASSFLPLILSSVFPFDRYLTYFSFFSHRRTVYFSRVRFFLRRYRNYLSILSCLNNTK